jgi:hypothetical protein
MVPDPGPRLCLDGWPQENDKTLLDVRKKLEAESKKVSKLTPALTKMLQQLI